MSKTISLTLNATEIKMAVKSDTYITGQIDKSADMVKNAPLAFNEQAGDETYHETKLYRTLRGSLATFESSLAEYIETSDSDASISDDLTSTSTTFTILIRTNSRTSGAFANTMAHLAQDFIINHMLYYWWQPIKPALAKDYLGFAGERLSDVKRCLAKTAPSSNAAAYDNIHGTVIPILPEYSGQTDGYFYLKDTVIYLQTSVTNPIVFISQGTVKTCVNISGHLFYFDEYSGVSVTDFAGDGNIVNDVSNAAASALGDVYDMDISSSATPDERSAAPSPTAKILTN